MHSCACYGHGQSTSENLVYVPKLYLLPYTKVQGALPDFIRALDSTPNVRYSPGNLEIAWIPAQDIFAA